MQLTGVYEETKCLTVGLMLQTVKSLLMPGYQISCSSSKLCNEACQEFSDLTIGYTTENIKM